MMNRDSAQAGSRSVNGSPLVQPARRFALLPSAATRRPVTILMVNGCNAGRAGAGCADATAQNFRASMKPALLWLTSAIVVSASGAFAQGKGDVCHKQYVSCMERCSSRPAKLYDACSQKCEGTSNQCYASTYGSPAPSTAAAPASPASPELPPSALDQVQASAHPSQPVPDQPPTASPQQSNSAPDQPPAAAYPPPAPTYQPQVAPYPPLAPAYQPQVTGNPPQPSP